MTDLFGLEQQPKRTNDHKEAAALLEVLKALKAHPAVAWCERQNTGSARIGGRFVRFGWPGCSDVLGQLRDGRFLAVEVKAPKGKLRPEQAVFLERINGAGGLGFVARDCRDVHRELAPSDDLDISDLLPDDVALLDSLDVGNLDDLLIDLPDGF